MKLFANSQFLAAREVSNKYKKLEGTGGEIVMAACRHDVVHTAVEMHEGETFRDTLTAHIECRNSNAQFLINDVICQYWDFAKGIEPLMPKYQYLTENMRHFLSRVHGQAHGWYCQASFVSTRQTQKFQLTFYYCIGSIFWPLEKRGMYVTRRRNQACFFHFWTLPKLN